MISDEAPPGYKILFGGVVGQELVNVTRDDKDIAAAIKVSLEHVYGKNAQHHHVKEVEKHVRLACTYVVCVNWCGPPCSCVPSHKPIHPPCSIINFPTQGLASACIDTSCNTTERENRLESYPCVPSRCVLA